MSQGDHIYEANNNNTNTCYFYGATNLASIPEFYQIYHRGKMGYS